MLQPVTLPQEQAILTKLDCSAVPLTTASVPILTLLCKVKRGNASIECYLASEQKNHQDIEVFCTQAIRLFTPIKPFEPTSELFFECVPSLKRFWMVYNLLTREDSEEDTTRINGILNEYAFLPVFNEIIPIIISCFPIQDLSILLRPLLLSTLAAEHISNLIMNIPCICSDVCTLLVTCLKMNDLDIQQAIVLSLSRLSMNEPSIHPSSSSTTTTTSSTSSTAAAAAAAVAVSARLPQDHITLWRCSHVFLGISQQSINLAKAVRHALVNARMLPGLSVSYHPQLPS